MINFFAKPPFVMKHLQRVSSIVRGEQIAAYMGNARLNPPTIDQDDINIYVKPHIKPGSNFKFLPNSWVDIHEAIDLVPTLQDHPEVGVIAFSELDVETLSKLLPNRIVLIPHHHLNFERIKRERNQIKKVGLTGSQGAFDHVPELIKEGLKKRGVELAFHSVFYPRNAVVKFHHSLDIHLMWRPFLKRKLSCPFKIVNASSFGVPTIALDEPSFKEVEGCYIGVTSPEQWLKVFDDLVANPTIYNSISDYCIKTAEKYHIDNISKLYEAL